MHKVNVFAVSASLDKTVYGSVPDPLVKGLARKTNALFGWNLIGVLYESQKACVYW